MYLNYKLLLMQSTKSYKRMFGNVKFYMQFYLIKIPLGKPQELLSVISSHLAADKYNYTFMPFQSGTTFVHNLL